MVTVIVKVTVWTLTHRAKFWRPEKNKDQQPNGKLPKTFEKAGQLNSNTYRRQREKLVREILNSIGLLDVPNQKWPHIASGHYC